jgi:hypothetical protein
LPPPLELNVLETSLHIAIEREICYVCIHQVLFFWAQSVKGDIFNSEFFCFLIIKSGFSEIFFTSSETWTHFDLLGVTVSIKVETLITFLSKGLIFISLSG